MKSNPYRITDNIGEHWPNRFSINFSGGRSSGYMLYKILEAYDFNLPDNIKIVFCNTGKENPETLEFVHEFEKKFDLDIYWLEYRCDRTQKPKHIAIRVDYETCSRNGEPFENLILTRQYLPNPVERICTYELKKMTAYRYLKRDAGWGKRGWNPVIGFRNDEKRRANKVYFEECLKEEKGYVMFPMNEAGATLEDVNSFWESMSFNVDLEEWEGNCDHCFLKKDWKQVAIIRKKPHLVQWWKDMESIDGIKQFRKEYTFEHLEDVALGRVQTLLDFGGEEDMSCFCTD